MAGFNGQEGGIMVALLVASQLRQRNESLDDGCSLEMVTESLMGACSLYVTDQAPELCAHFYIQAYGLDTAEDNKERTVRFGYLLGK